MKIFTITLLLAGITSFNNVICQDIHFSQYDNNPLQINPALTGAIPGNIRAALGHKSQWNNFTSGYNTYTASFDMLLPFEGSENAFGWGLFVSNDQAGSAQMNHTDLRLSGAYHMKIASSQTLSLGIQGGYSMGSVNTSSFEWGNQYDGNGFNSNLQSNEVYSSTDKGFADFSSGFVWTFKNETSTITSNDGVSGSIGFSANHLTSPKYSFLGSDEKLHLKYLVHGKLKLGITNTNWALIPGGMIALQGGSKEIIVGSNFRYLLKEQSQFSNIVKETAISFGSFYRINDAFIVGVQLEKSNFTLGFSYDINTSSLTGVSNGKGGPEITLKFINPNPFNGTKSSARFN